MKAYITINRTKLYCPKLCIKLIIPMKNLFTFVMPLKWAAIIGYMQAKGRPFYSNDVIWLHQVTVPLNQETVPLFELHQIQPEWCDTELHFTRNSQLIHVLSIRDRNPKSVTYTAAFSERSGRPTDICLSSHLYAFCDTTCGQLVVI